MSVFILYKKVFNINCIKPQNTLGIIIYKQVNKLIWLMWITTLKCTIKLKLNKRANNKKLYQRKNNQKKSKRKAIKEKKVAKT